MTPFTMTRRLILVALTRLAGLDTPYQKCLSPSKQLRSIHKRLFLV